jgi:hypothetical protein
LTVHDIEDSSSPPQLLHQETLNFPPPPGKNNNNETSSSSPPLSVTILIPLLEQHDDNDDDNDDDNNYTATPPLLLVVPDRPSSSSNSNITTQPINYRRTSRILIVALWKNDSILVTRRLATLPKERRRRRQTTTATMNLLPTVAHVDLIYYDEFNVDTSTTTTTPPSSRADATSSSTSTAASNNPATRGKKNDWISWWQQLVCGYIMVGIYEYWIRRKPRLSPRDHRRVELVVVQDDDAYQERVRPESEEQGSESSSFEEEEDEDEEDHEGESDSSMFDDDGGVVVPLDAMELARLRRLLAMQTPNEEVDAEEPCSYSATAEPSEAVDVHRPKYHTIMHPPRSFPPAAVVAKRQTVQQEDDERLPPPDQETSILHAWSQLLAQTQRLSADPDLPDHVRRLLQLAAVRDEDLQQYGGTEEDLELSGNPPTHDYCHPESTPDKAGEMTFLKQSEMLAEEMEFSDVIDQPMINTAVHTTAIPPTNILKDTDRNDDSVPKSRARDVVPDTSKDTDGQDGSMSKSNSMDDCQHMTMGADKHSPQNWRRGENTLVAYFSMPSQTQCQENPNTDDNLMDHATPFGEDRDSPQVPLGTVDHAMDLREEAETILNDPLKSAVQNPSRSES